MAALPGRGRPRGQGCVVHAPRRLVEARREGRLLPPAPAATGARGLRPDASIGLLEAMSRFDVARGVDFRAYAKARVRGAVFNGVRSLLAEPKAERRLSDRLDMFEHAGDVDPLDAMIDTVAGLGVSYLLDVASAAGAGEPDASAYASSAHGERVLLDAIDRLPDRLGMIISAHYFHHVPFVQIAERLSLTKGRVSQLHRQAIDRLRESIREQGIMGAGDV